MTSFTPYHLKCMFYLLFLDEEYRDQFFTTLNPETFILDKELYTLARAYWLFKDKYEVFPDQHSYVEEVFQQGGKNIELFSTPPTSEYLALLFEYFLNNIVTMEAPQRSYITDITLRVIKLINMHKVINKYKDEINKGTVDTDAFAQELLDSTSISDTSDVGINALDNLDLRTEHRLSASESLDVVPINIPGLSDYIEDGGVPPGTLSFWLGATGIGKTTALITTTKIAVLANKKVLYVSAELAIDQILKRFDSAMTGIPILDIKSRATNVREILRTTPRYTTALSNLVVQEVPMGVAKVSDIESVVKYYINKKGWKPDLLVVDYADNLAPSKSNPNATRLEIYSIYRELRALGQKYKFAVWTASQLNDAGTAASEEDNGRLSTRHVNEARGKAHLADLIIGIGRSPQEHQQSLARLQLVKNRLGGNEGTMVHIATNYACSLLWTSSSPISAPPPSSLTGDAPTLESTGNTMENFDKYLKNFEEAEQLLA